MKNLAYFMIVAMTTVITLIYGQNLILPFLLGLLFWFIMRSLKTSLNRIGFIKKYFPSWLKTLLSSGLIFIFLTTLFNILSTNISKLTHSYSKYESNVDAVIANINEYLHLDILETLQKQMGNFDFGALLSTVFNSMSDIISNTFMIIIYALFILLEESNFSKKMKAVFTNQSQYDEFWTILGQIEQSVLDYFRLKAFVSLITGGLSYLALLLIGVDSPVFWAFLIFILNFIPTIGSLIGTLFPAGFALLQFGDINTFVLILVIVGIIQILVGNVLEPRLMGSSMNISPLVTILSLSIWGAIWGVVGMILSVPIVVVMIIVFSHFEKTRPIAILLSEKGEV